MAAAFVARGSSFMISKHLLETIEPFNLLGIRSMLAFAALMLIFGRRVIEAIKSNPGYLTAGATIGLLFFIVMALELNSIRYTTTSTVSFIQNSAVVLVPITDALIKRRRPSSKAIMCAAMSLAGIVCIASRGMASGVGIGETMCMISALVYTAAILQIDRKAKILDPFVIGVLYVGFIGMYALIASLLTETPHVPQDAKEWGMLLTLALVVSAFGFSVQPVAQKTLSAETTGLMTAINPLTAAVLGAAVLHEKFGIASIIGAMLILTGLITHNLTDTIDSHEISAR